MNARPFLGLPRLPAVPPPIAGETLSGWVSCLGEIYGLSTDRLLRGMGAPPPRQLRWLDIAPSSRVLAALSAQTGVAVAFMRERMTFHRLGRELAPTVLASKPLCRRCVVEADAAGRMVERLRWIAPWRFACEQHPPLVSAEEMDGRLDAAAMLRDVTLFSKRLAYAAAEDPSRPFPSIARSAADCIRLVRGINDRLRLRVCAGRNGVAVFEVREVRPGPGEAIAPERRNRLVVSAWYAWHVMTNPDGAIHQHTRSADREQAHALTVLLAGFLPGEQMVAAWQHGAELVTAARWRPPDPDDNAARQARLLLDLMSAMPDARPHTLSPFEYPDFGRRFVPALYLPGPLLAARSESIPLRASAWPSARPSIGATAPLSSPLSPATLEPYLALVQEARAKLAALGGRVRSGDVERLAFRILRERGISHD
ncbi:MAG TPA: TniQ family protein [Acetobacteraceae bacterium]|nr:TniQ family protein [Acetobacteraceae bacterium]